MTTQMTLVLRVVMGDKSDSKKYQCPDVVMGDSSDNTNDQRAEVKMCDKNDSTNGLSSGELMSD